MNPINEYLQAFSRRQFFRGSGLALGSVALQMLSADVNATTKTERVHPAIPGFPHFMPKAKRLIYLHMNGAPSQIDLLDHKPVLQEQSGKDLPPSVRGDQRLSTMTSGQAGFPIAPSIFKFSQHGKCGAWFSELLPWTSKLADDLAIIKTVHTSAINHDPASNFLMTGSELPGKASLGAWLSYGLGSENNNLPAFVVMTPTWSSKATAQPIPSRLWGSGFLPGKVSGVAFRGQGDPILYLDNPPGVDGSARRAMLDSLNQFNLLAHERYGDPETLTRIAQYELAFRLQSSVPELSDFSSESDKTLDLYGPDVKKRGTFAASCLLARRLAERDVRCVQIYHRGWDQHNNLPADIRLQCQDVDQACYGLITDLKNRGLLEDTLVVWGGEFGRTVYSQGTLTNQNYGRDHHPRCYSMWMAGGGVKAGLSYGETDDFSYNIAHDPVSLFDLNATILHCLGIDHERFTYKFQGLDQKLTGVEPASVVKGILE